MTVETSRQFAGSASHISLMHRPYGPRIHMDENAASAPAAEASPILAPAIDASEGVSIDQAYEAYQKRTNPTAESAEPATAETELSVEDNAAPREEATGETQEGDPAEKPSLDLPRSWTKDRAEVWAKLDPATQEILLEQDRKASIEVRRVQNEAAESRKAADAERSHAEQARQNYEAKLPALMQSLQAANQADFADVKTVDDVSKMAAEDPFRYLQWQALQTKLHATNSEIEKANVDRSAKQISERNTRRTDETAKLIKEVPEFADKTKLEAAQKAAAQLFRDVGYSDAELATMGDERLLDDHRIQVIINDAMKFRALQRAKVTAIPKPVPNVQRPGAATPSRGSDLIQASRNKLNSTGSVDDAYALYQAKQKARA